MGTTEDIRMAFFDNCVKMTHPQMTGTDTEHTEKTIHKSGSQSICLCRAIFACCVDFILKIRLRLLSILLRLWQGENIQLAGASRRCDLLNNLIKEKKN